MSKSDRFGGSVYTQEGNLAGSRAARLEKARLDHLNAVARERAELSASSTSTLSQLRDVNSKFKRQILESQDSSDSSVYGLKTRDEFAKAQDESIRRKGLTALQKAEEDRLKQSEKDKALLNKSKKRKRKEREKMKNLLSFSFEEDNQDEGEDTSGTSAHASASNNEREKKRKTEQDGEDVEAEDKMVLTKDPTVETSFLPDRDREEQRRREIVRLKQEWLSSQDKVKQEIIEVVYSYWDGSGHRRKVKVTKGTTIESFLETVRKSLIKEFPHLRSASAETLMYVKEDIIIPHEATFYDLIMSKARGKTGPLFNFDVKDDVRLVNDVRTQTDHSHAGKICERHWYERNKHIYPASRWEVLDLSNVFADLARKAPTEQDLIKLVDVTPPEQP